MDHLDQVKEHLPFMQAPENAGVPGGLMPGVDDPLEAAEWRAATAADTEAVGDAEEEAWLQDLPRPQAASPPPSGSDSGVDDVPLAARAAEMAVAARAARAQPPPAQSPPAARPPAADNNVNLADIFARMQSAEARQGARDAAVRHRRLAAATAAQDAADAAAAARAYEAHRREEKGGLDYPPDEGRPQLGGWQNGRAASPPPLAHTHQAAVQPRATPAAKPPPVRPRQRQQAARRTVVHPPREAADVVAPPPPRPPPLALTIVDVERTVLAWDYTSIASGAATVAGLAHVMAGGGLPSTFPDQGGRDGVYAYVDQHKELVLEEARATLLAEADEVLALASGDDAPARPHVRVESAAAVTAFAGGGRVHRLHLTALPPDTRPSVGDLVLLEPADGRRAEPHQLAHRVHALALVKRVDRGLMEVDTVLTAPATTAAETAERLAAMHAAAGTGRELRMTRLMPWAPFERQLAALASLPRLESALLRELMVPDGVAAERAGERGVDDAVRAAASAARAQGAVAGLNAAQGDAYAAAVAPAHGRRIVLIRGPPGTGKTHTLATIVAALVAGASSSSTPRRVLVCAQSNAAVDELARRVAAQPGLAGRVVRVGRNRAAHAAPLQGVVMLGDGGDAAERRLQRQATLSNALVVAATLSRAGGDVAAGDTEFAATVCDEAAAAADRRPSCRSPCWRRAAASCCVATPPSCRPRC